MDGEAQRLGMGLDAVNKGCVPGFRAIAGHTDNSAIGLYPIIGVASLAEFQHRHTYSFECCCCLVLTGVDPQFSIQRCFSMQREDLLMQQSPAKSTAELDWILDRTLPRMLRVNITQDAERSEDTGRMVDRKLAATEYSGRSRGCCRECE